MGVIHFIHVRMACRIQKIMAAKTQQVCQKRSALFLPHLLHSFLEKASCLFFMHLNAKTAHRIFTYHKIKQDIRPVKSDSEQISIFPDHLFYFLRQLPIYFLNSLKSCWSSCFSMFCIILISNDAKPGVSAINVASPILYSST